ncbi:uncharacterized protein LOC111697420 [Eurytemora carolleeae]|uniref:uncharacterized protein LOC111697420 n=1 Tax=Eurytemora carolleeae TaxID=1294199 RepID=UPI000C775B00|nr:uncharacterized protein LOC111697420 [Eurytemora carolleeae]|eukprot:XP_023323210.1 uncharacterized protein LOC111697420 [Eurytemora affinis]
MTSKFTFGLLFILLILAKTQADVCPHPRFIREHLCTGCSTTEEALAFSGSKPLNTVLAVSSDPDYNHDGMHARHQESVCTVNNARIDTVWQCRGDRGYCNAIHQNVKCSFEHATNNGHFFYNQLICNN